MSISGTARSKLAYHVQSTRAASAPYTAQSETPALKGSIAGSPMAPTHVESMIGLLYYNIVLAVLGNQQVSNRAVRKGCARALHMALA